MSVSDMLGPEGARAAGADMRQLVSFRIGQEQFGLDIVKVQEIIRLQRLTRVPNLPDFVEGVINLRGKIVSVIDLRKRFGQRATGLDRRSRILVVEHRGRLVGMIVDSASEVLKIPESEIEAAPVMMQEGGLDCVTGLGKYQGRLIILLDIGKVLAARNNEAPLAVPAEKAAASAQPGMKAGAKAQAAMGKGAGVKNAAAGK